MLRLLSTFTLLVYLLCSCASQKSESTSNDLIGARNSLAEASYAVSHSLTNLAETAQAAHPLATMPPPPSPASYGMGGLTSVDWSGPVEPIAKQIANTAGYRLTTLGTAPAIPIIVTIYEKNAMLGDILRDIGYQCGRRASIAIYPANRVVELRYAKN